MKYLNTGLHEKRNFEIINDASVPKTVHLIRLEELNLLTFRDRSHSEDCEITVTDRKINQNNNVFAEGNNFLI